MENRAQQLWEGQDWSWDACRSLLAQFKASKRDEATKETPQAWDYGYEGANGDPHVYQATRKDPKLVQYINGFLKHQLCAGGT